MKGFLKITAAIVLSGLIGCEGTDGNGPVNLPGKTNPSTPGTGGSGGTSQTEPTEVIVGKPLPLWTEGCLDIHHINTGRGESAFYILPDGTTMLIDAKEACSRGFLCILQACRPLHSQ